MVSIFSKSLRRRCERDSAVMRIHILYAAAGRTLCIIYILIANGGGKPRDDLCVVAVWAG